MGNDVTYIHLYIEYKDDNGKWTLDEDQKCKECNGTGRISYFKFRDKGIGTNEHHFPCHGFGYKKYDIGGEDGFKSNRIYVLFSILARVRITFDSLNPISNPRGIPKDSSNEYKKIANYIFGNHSHSYHTLKQLKEYDGKWDSTDDQIYDWKYLKKYLPLELEELAKKYGGDDNVRIVFYFNRE